MPKTTITYEASDIDVKNNDLHKTLYGGLLISAVTLTLPPTPEDMLLPKEQRHEKNGREVVALFLSIMENSGFSITKAETVPPVFNEFFRS